LPIVAIQSYRYIFLSEDNSAFISSVIKKHPESLSKDGNRIDIEFFWMCKKNWALSNI